MSHPRDHFVLSTSGLPGLLACAVAMVVTAAGRPALAQEIDLGGSASTEIRFFVQSPAFLDQLRRWQPSLTLEPELALRSANRRHQFKATPYVRLDAQDDERTHFDVREAFWRGVFGDWEVLAGVGKVFWGVTESRHLVDVINQTDLLEDIDDEDKLGQPMVRVALQRPWGRLAGFVLLGLRERQFPGGNGRLRGPFPVADEDSLFPDGRRDVDLALRYSHFLGDFDVGVHLFHGNGREPAFVVEATFGPEAATTSEVATASDDTLVGTPRLLPLYRTITQGGVDVQYTRGAWLWKLEALVRGGEGDPFLALVGGFEYTLYQLGTTAADLGLLAELLYDDRDATAPPSPFDNDLFVGARLAVNDIQDTSVLAGAIVDLHNGTIAARLEGERRVADRFRLELESRIFANVDATEGLAPLRRDSFLTLRLGYFF